ncbi:hypothetical protein ACFE04_019227 [Oxalis oulophora]
MADEIAQVVEGTRVIWNYMLGYIDSMALKCAVELRLADIIHAHDCPMTLTQIVAAITIDSPSSTPNIDYLSRIMRYLVNMKIFTCTIEGEETLYGPTTMSIWFSKDFEMSLAPFLRMVSHPTFQGGYNFLSDCVKDGGMPFTKANGCDQWTLLSKEPLANKIFNQAMASNHPSSMIVMSQYEGLKSIQTLVNVGGGTGEFLAQIVEEYPNIEGINFDLPHVIATAPVHHGIVHVGGDMFESIPQGETILLKFIMHDWPDKECIQILKNCRKAIHKKGKVVIVDMVLQPREDGSYCEIGLKSDLQMLATTSGGKERTELEWKTIFNEVGFSTYKIITGIPPVCIIEAYA